MDTEASVLLLDLTLHTSSSRCLFVSFIINRGYKYSIFLSSMSHSRKLSNPKEGVTGALEFIVGWTEVWVPWAAPFVAVV